MDLAGRNTLRVSTVLFADEKERILGSTWEAIFDLELLDSANIWDSPTRAGVAPGLAPGVLERTGVLGGYDDDASAGGSTKAATVSSSVASAPLKTLRCKNIHQVPSSGKPPPPL